MPEFLESRLHLGAEPASPRGPGTGYDGPPLRASWSPPSRPWCTEHKRAIKEALGSLEVCCAAAPEPFVRELLARCAEVKHSREGSPAEWSVRIAEYLRLLGHYPADIWQAAVDGHMLASRFFPDISELETRMAPAMTDRRLGIDRLEAMLAPRPALPPPPSETPEQRAAMTLKLKRLSSLMSSGAGARMTEAEQRHFCETGEYPAGWVEAEAARAPAKPPTARERRRSAALQVGAAAARAAFVGEAPPAAENGGGPAGQSAEGAGG